MEDYAELNRASWDERAPAHAASRDYAVERFASDPGHLSEVVRFDLPLLGDIGGLRGVHLQCHIGTDTVSLARLGADMTGLDFSPASLAEARRIASLAGADVRFVEAEVYDAAGALGPEPFDLVYTGIGALCWLPDIARWARVVAGLLRPGGRLFIREGHPMLWALDDPRPDGLLAVEYPYFEREGAHGLRRGGHLRRDRRGLHPQPDPRVEPRPRRDRHRADGRRDGPDRARRARQRAVGRPARARWSGSGAASGGWPTARGASPTPTRLQAVRRP